MKNCVLKSINYNTIHDITQKSVENPMTFLNKLKEALLKYNKLDLQ